MNQKAITAVLFSAIIAFCVASWGRMVEWWVDISPFWQAFTFSCTWLFLMLAGLYYGPVYALAALIAGIIALLLLLFNAGKKFLSE